MFDPNGIFKNSVQNGHNLSIPIKRTLIICLLFIIWLKLTIFEKIKPLAIILFRFLRTFRTNTFLELMYIHSFCLIQHLCVFWKTYHLKKYSFLEFLIKVRNIIDIFLKQKAVSFLILSYEEISITLCIQSQYFLYASLCVNLWVYIYSRFQ